MFRRGRPQRPIIYQRRKSAFWWIRYRDKEGKLHKESTGTVDQNAAEQILQERLKARDEGRLPILFASRKVIFGAWLDWYLETRSKPPFRAQKTHEQNLNAAKYLRPVFGELPLSEITADAIEDYIHERLQSKRKVHKKLGVEFRDAIRPVTVHQEFRVLRRLLNVAVKKKLLAVTPCSSVEFPMILLSATRKPHYMTFKRAKEDRVLCARLPETDRDHNFGDGITSAEGTLSNAQIAARPGKRGRAHSRFEDSQRCGGYAHDVCRETGVSRASPSDAVQ